MSRKTKIIVGLCGLVLVGGTLGLMFLAASQQFQETCEACVEFRGRVQCREAQGATRDEAIRTARDNACALLATGRKENIECTTAALFTSTCR